MLTEWLTSEYIGGSAGMQDPNIDGFMLDDAWLPAHGRNDSIPGGPSEMDAKAVRDMGLSPDAVRDMWRSTADGRKDLRSKCALQTGGQMQSLFRRPQPGSSHLFFPQGRR